mmetsp:Transcript_29008/g.40128  ORF Transcript_29008/g.40128 Transcript_29008/m.40128 type:complete len:394 (+) Transcript_29008:74-1255(+)|eukprot:CAMPEP_0201488734 /NCGR_PEP_ID=MMETSP0151_2-20130828/19348_1 /ASSEMBLY_ACC=CAM_ASM_000257 /TAXON_ID=200890 /ORGANISM="Paramoeba atlantica, Strain 621/1 / CCAP 1560/9" /LENGTH=393 /DNA_ID=CAMNT_0047874087 /DNA_START=64 /DNA_END=1245 /DNA_ORIENTATION=-
MSSGTVNPSLKSAFEAANQGGATRTIVVKVDVDSEELSSVADARSTVSVQRDYQQLQTFADMYGPCWFLVRHQAKDWRIYTYCPDSEAVKVKMLYSTAKDTLLKALGMQFFTNDLHATTKEELLYTKIEEASKPAGDSVLSKWELEHKAIIRAESEEAKERAVSRPSNGDGIGGYHTVNLPLAPSAKSMMGDFKVGSASFVELKVSEDKEQIEGVSQSTIASLGGVQSKLNKGEPRFYLISASASSYLLYMCPDSSPISVRMVYSTVKPAVSEAAKACGIRLTRVLEASDAADVDAGFFQRPASSPYRSSAPVSPAGRQQEPEWLKKRNEVIGGGGVVRSPNSRPNSGSLGDGGGTKAPIQISAAHPTAQLLGNQTNSPGPKKKIVVPPQGAW